MSIRTEKLDFWVQHKYNVLFIGRHGVGKTSIVKDTFERAGLKWKYYSASTMDPWVDFIGVPREVKDEKGESYLDLIRPKDLQHDEVEAIFFDEFNRSPAKVRNAVMELLQFKSINGRKFNNLKMIWAAINPEESDEYGKDSSYDVQTLDPAQRDRFQVEYELPYRLDNDFFKQKYGDEKAAATNEWWRALPKEIQIKVSPRRVDYALQTFLDGGDVRDVLPKQSAPGKLLLKLNEGSFIAKMKGLMTESKEVIRQFLENENNYEQAIPWITKRTERMDRFLPLLPKEKISVLISKPAKEGVKSKDEIIDFYCKLSSIDQNIKEILNSICDVRGNKEVINKIMDRCREYSVDLNCLVKERERVMKAKEEQLAASDKVNSPAKGVKIANPNRYADWKDLTASSVIHNTVERKKFWHVIYDKLTSSTGPISSFPVEDLNNLFLILNNIVQRSHGNTLKTTFKGFIEYLKKVLGEYQRRTIHSYNELLPKREYQKLKEKMSYVGVDISNMP